ncbi:MAG: RND family efflux transporter MFP subunit [Cryomorphaceae bacterium]|jgi:RND family efflux transporter MFP subunit
MNYYDIPSQLVLEDEQYSKKKVFIIVGLGVFLALALAAYQFSWIVSSEAQSAVPSGPPPVAVVVAQAQTMTMAPYTVLPGTVVSVRDAVIASEASGRILNVANIGDVVTESDSIAQIDSSDALQLVAQRQAELQRLKSLLTYHTDYFKRIGAAKNKLGVSEIGIAELKSNRDTARAEVAKAESELKAAENDLQRTSITAPFPGSVVSQSIQQGEYAQIGSAIVRLVDTANLEVSARVPASLVHPIKPGTMLEISGMGKTFLAPLRALVPVGDSVSRTMELRVELKDSGLLVGTPVRVSLPSAQAKEVVAIPRDAVILRTDAQYVYVIEDGIASRRDVQLGYAQEDMIEVLGYVSPNAVVVIRGGERLRDGQSVSWENTAGEVGIGGASNTL